MKYIKVLRPHHWIKNILLLAAPFFGGVLFFPDNLMLSLPVLLSFSLTASSIYIINDIKDRHKDRLHPRKKHRPIASGQFSPEVAFIYGILLLLPSWILAYSISTTFLYYTVLYFVIQILYSLILKNLALVDIFCIAAGFVIRVLAGGAAFGVDVSPWLFLTMFMISLVLATGKRLSEAELLEDSASSHRITLRAYNKDTLREVLIIASSSALITYALYTIEEYQQLVYTVPVVTFGLFRYLLIAQKGLGDATEALLKDRILFLTVIIWLFSVWYMRY